MEKNTINFRARLTEDNHKILKKFNEKNKVPINRIINILISSMDTEFEFMQSDIINEIETEIRFKITESEKEFLEEQSLKSGANSLSAEIKYRLLNTIYKNEFFTNNEMKELIKSRYELNKIGLNLNQLLKQIYTKEELRLDKEEIKSLIMSIDTSIREHKKELSKLLLFTRNRF